jgi:peptide/nickel transport system ATP-binding protein
MPPILELDRVSKTFWTVGSQVNALTDVTLSFEPGRIHAVVGESGSGKSTLAALVLGMLTPTSGEIRFRGEALKPRRTLDQRRLIQLVQQNPLSSLNPKRTIGQSIRLPLDVHRIGDTRSRDGRVQSLLSDVGLAGEFAGRRPSTLSGGQRQRVAVARALACEPEVILFDEPTSALDVLVQARLLRLLLRIRESMDQTFRLHHA